MEVETQAMILSFDRHQHHRGIITTIIIIIIIILWSCLQDNTNASMLGGSADGPKTVKHQISARSTLANALEAYHHSQQQEQGHHQHHHQDRLENAMYHGTTTCAFIFDQGILVAVDSRASMGKEIGAIRFYVIIRSYS